ncbi:MAG: hypothetical protein AAF329_21430, partial [Cyanobacteria bacterium P01_A01_bin.17]
MTQDQPTPQEAAQAPKAQQQKVEPDIAQAPEVKVAQNVAAQPPEPSGQKATPDPEAAPAPETQDKQKQATPNADPVREARKQRRAAQNVAPAPEARKARRPNAASPPPAARRQRKTATEKIETPQAAEAQKPKPTSPVTKAVQTATQILTSVFNTVKKPIVGSKAYTNNKAKFDSGWKRVQPLVKVIQWLWKQILKPFWTRVVQPLWGKILGLLRPRLPGPLKTLSDQILTAIIIWPLVLLWWLVSSLTSATPVVQS